MKAHFENESTFWKWKHILKMKAHFENESSIRKMKAHFETHFENENMFLEKWKVISGCWDKKPPVLFCVFRRFFLKKNTQRQ